jgi:hypothetical protein
MRDGWRMTGKPMACAAMIRALIIPAGMLLLAGCSTTDKDYAGPELPASSLAIVEVGKTGVFDGVLPLGMSKIDGVDHAGAWAADQMVPFANQEYHLLPGMHTFELLGPSGRGIVSSGLMQSFQVTALLAPGKRYRIVGRRDSLDGKVLAVWAMTGIVMAHIELVDETDGGTIQGNWNIPMTSAAVSQQAVSGLPVDAAAPPSSAAVAPGAPAPEPAAMRYADWAKQKD